MSTTRGSRDRATARRPTETPCSGEVCQGPPSVPQLLSPAASATFEGLGDIPPEAVKD